MDRKILNLLRRVALHTPDKVTTLVVQEAYYANGPITLKAVGAKLPSLSSETISNVFTKLYRISVVIKTTDAANVTTYALTPQSRGMFRDAGIFDNIPPYDPFYRAGATVTQKKVVLRRAT